METMHQIACRALDDLPPTTRFTTQHAQIITHHQALLLSWEPDVIRGFYDTLYTHPPTAAVFTDGERPHREQTLARWWRRTVTGPLDEDYFAWMAMVGLVHVLRGVSNPMMLAMTGYVVTAVTDHARQAQLPAPAAEHLVDAFNRLTATVAAIITCGYDHAVASALYNIAGMPHPLLRRLRDHEVADALTIARAETQPNQP
jgi:hypothetical protein